MGIGFHLALGSCVRRVHERLGDLCGDLVRPDTTTVDLRADALSLEAEVHELVLLTRMAIDSSVDSPSGDATETEADLWATG